MYIAWKCYEMRRLWKEDKDMLLIENIWTIIECENI